jgi:glutamate synthase domain-containing protein 1
MCGIVGYLDKRGGTSPVGQKVLAMLRALGCRGPDSAGIALFHLPAGWQVRFSVPSRFAPGTVNEAAHALGLVLVRDHGNGVFDTSAPGGSDAITLEDGLRARLDAEVIGLGERLDLFKQVGSPAELEKTYQVSRMVGTHGIGHTRLSTESRVDLSHSQPFWAHGIPDLATVHNGHITNYHKLRRHYEQRGYRFYTENDSEVIGVYLRDRMNAGLSLPDALRSSLDDFDGSFCYLAASANCLAYVRDRFGFKPLMLAQTEDFVALATEEIALRQALGKDFEAREPAPGTMRIWYVPQEASDGRIRSNV